MIVFECLILKGIIEKVEFFGLTICSWRQIPGEA